MTELPIATVNETRWLDETQQQAWRSFLGGTTVLMDRLDRDLRSEHGLSMSEYEILVRLSEAPGWRLRMSDLADASESSRSRLSHAVARLEEAGWVTREACPTDRRGAFAVLTQTGFDALAAAAPGHVEAVRRHLFDRLSPEQVKQLGEISDAIIDGLRADDPHRRPPASTPATGPAGDVRARGSV